MIIPSDKQKAFSCLSYQARLHIELMDARTDYEKLLAAITYDKPSLVKFYLDSGVSANSPEGSETSPIFYAAVHNNPLIVKMLLAYGANPNFEHRLTHQTIIGRVFKDYDNLMKHPVNHSIVNDKLNKLVMIAAIMQHAGLRFDTPNSKNESPLDKFGLWVGRDRKEQVLAEFLERINHADVDSIRPAEVNAQPPEAIIHLSPEEEQKIAAFRAGRYSEILSYSRAELSTSMLAIRSILNSSHQRSQTTQSSNSRLELSANIRMLNSIHRPIDRSAQPMQETMQSLRILALLMGLYRLAEHRFSSASQQNNLSPGLNATLIEEHGFPSEEIPNEYICPLSLQIMSDPVYLSNDETRQRFERNWLTNWLKDKGTHPTTRKSFKVTDLQEDSDLKNNIAEFMQNIRGAMPLNRK